MSRLAWVVCVLCAVGCARDPERRAIPGQERGDCRADKTCDPGLWCLSNLCVAPPPADCTLLGEQLASTELGNYAEPEVRAPVVAKYKAACEAARVTKEQGECIDQAPDKWTAAQCAPRMFPELASTGSDECAKVSQKIRTALLGQQPGLAGDSQGWFETMIKVMHQACAEDAWPDALKQCILASTLNGQDAMQTCNAHMPPALMEKLSQRLTEAMQPPVR